MTVLACTCTADVILAAVIAATAATIVATAITLWCCGYRPGLNT